LETGGVQIIHSQIVWELAEADKNGVPDWWVGLWSRTLAVKLPPKETTRITTAGRSPPYRGRLSRRKKAGTTANRRKVPRISETRKVMRPIKIADTICKPRLLGNQITKARMTTAKW